MASKALVTGATGFVGRVLCPFLQANGWEVIPIGVSGEEGHACNIANAAAVQRLIADVAPFTHVIHLAAIAHQPQALEHPEAAFEVNTVGTVNLAAAVMKEMPEARFINIGSGAQYGPSGGDALSEDHPLAPDTPYSISKTAAEQYCRYAHKTLQLDCVMLRPFNHSGPGQPPGFVLPAFAKQIATIAAGKAEPIIRVGNLDAARDFLHVDDVVRAYMLAAQKGKSGNIYNIASGAARTIRSLLDRLIQLSGVDVTVEIDPARLRPVDVPSIAGNATKLTTDCGWTPEKTIDDLLTDLLNYWRDQV